jgi:hypothetical protein
VNVSLFSSFSGISPGGVKTPDTSGCFVNFYDHPIWIEDMVFDWDFTIPTRTAQTYGTPLGDAIRASIRYRNNPMTNGFVPVNLLARTENWPESTPQMLARGESIHSTYIWRFPCPLWLPPNVPLSIELFHQNDFTVNVQADAQRVDVSARGYLDESGDVPEYIDIPYATAFLGAVQSNVVAGTTGLEPPILEQTAQTDLFNPFTEPLNIARLQAVRAPGLRDFLELALPRHEVDPRSRRLLHRLPARADAPLHRSAAPALPDARGPELGRHAAGHRGRSA